MAKKGERVLLTGDGHCRVCGDSIPNGWKFCPICQTPANPRKPSSKTIYRSLGDAPEPDEVVGVKPETIARWRTFVPEDIISAIMRQRILIREARRIEEEIRTPDLAYPVPLLPKIEAEPKVFAIAIDCDGHLSERTMGADAIGRTDLRVLWRYRYKCPYLQFETDTYELTEKIANMLNTAVTPRTPKPPERIHVMYRTGAWTSRAMRAIQLAEPHFTKWKKRATEYLKRYKPRPSHTLKTPP